MDNSILGREEEMHTAFKVIKDDGLKGDLEVTEAIQVHKRRGRQGAAQSAQSLGVSSIGAEPSVDAEGVGQFRVIISKEANERLDQLLHMVNGGFDAGRVTRPQLVSWIICKSQESATNETIDGIRAAHFDKIAYLENLLKRAKETGELPKELNALLPATNTMVHNQKKIRKAN